MGDGTPNERKKRSVSTRLAGCFLILVLAVGVTLALAWYFLGRWTPVASAWNSLPAATTWAVEVHDFRQVVQGILAHPGMPEALETLARRQASTSVDDALIRRHFHAYHRWLRPIQTVILPNAFILGGIGGESEEVFLLFQPTPLLRWLLPSPERGIVALNINQTPFGRIHVGTRDAWAVAALTRETAALLLQGLDEEAAPFGPAPGIHGPYISLAGRSPTRHPAPPPVEQEAPGNFMLGDPFAAPSATQARELEPGVRLLILPERGAWRVLGEAFADAAGLPDAPELPVRILGSGMAAPDTYRPPRHPEVTVTAGLSPALRQRLLDLLDRSAVSREGVADPRVALGWRWFRHAWLGTVGSTIVLLLEKSPRIPDLTNAHGMDVDGEEFEEADVPPMPQMALGWTLGENLVPRLTGEAFTTALIAWLDAVKASSDTPLLRAMHNVVEYRVEEQGLEGVILLPSVPASGARPAWKHTVGTALPMGWLASYPSGIQDALRRGPPPFRNVRPADGFDAKAILEWHIDPALFADYAGWIRDRRDALPYGDREEDRIESILDTVAAARTLFPGGRMHAAYDGEHDRLIFSGILTGDTATR